jgi:hypothetical protein
VVWLSFELENEPDAKLANKGVARDGAQERRGSGKMLRNPSRLVHLSPDGVRFAFAASKLVPRSVAMVISPRPSVLIHYAYLGASIQASRFRRGDLPSAQPSFLPAKLAGLKGQGCISPALQARRTSVPRSALREAAINWEAPHCALAPKISLLCAPPMAFNHGRRVVFNMLDSRPSTFARTVACPVVALS